MNKKIIFLSFLLAIGMFFMVLSINTKPRLMSSMSQVNGAQDISFSLQETAIPPIQIPTVVIPPIVINPTSGDPGFLGQITPVMIMLFVLVGAIILIALVAVLKRS